MTTRKSTKKSKAAPATDAVAFVPDALVVRTAGPNGEASHGFIWPREVGAMVSAPDWEPTAECGHGLHGLLDGLGNWSLLSDSPNALWYIVEVMRSECVAIDTEKVKFPRGRVKYVGTPGAALREIMAEARDAMRRERAAFLAEHQAFLGTLAATPGDGAHSTTAGWAAHSTTAGWAAHSTTAGRAAHSTTAGEAAHSTTAGWAAHSTTAGRAAHSTTAGRAAHSTTAGWAAHSTTAGWAAHSTTAGWAAHSTTAGEAAHSTTAGRAAHSTTAGEAAHSTTAGPQSIAAALGPQAFARAGVEGWIVCTAWEIGKSWDPSTWKVLAVRAAKVGGPEGVQPNTWYRLTPAGEFEAVPATDLPAEVARA